MALTPVAALRPRLAAVPDDDDAALCALLARAGRGELAAFDQLYRQTRADAARTLAHLVGRRSDLEDLVQEAYLQLLKAARGFRGEARFRTFFYRVCANVALMHLRWWRRRPEELRPELPEVAVAAVGDPEREAHRAECRRLVEQALASVGAKKRIVFVYHELCGLMPEEIAEVVGCPPNTVRSRLHHARREFHEALQRLTAAPRRDGGGDGLL